MVSKGFLKLSMENVCQASASFKEEILDSRLHIWYIFSFLSLLIHARKPAKFELILFYKKKEKVCWRSFCCLSLA